MRRVGSLPLLFVVACVSAASAPPSRAAEPEPLCRAKLEVEVERELILPVPRFVLPPLGGLVDWGATPERPKRARTWGCEPLLERGEGWVVRDDGVVAAPTRLVRGATQVTVHCEGRRLPAEVIQSDPETGISLLRVVAKIPSPPLAICQAPQPGAEVRLSGACLGESCSHPKGVFLGGAWDGSEVLVYLPSGPPSASRSLSWLTAGGRAFAVNPRFFRVPLLGVEPLWLARATPLATLAERLAQTPPLPWVGSRPWDWIWKEWDGGATWEHWLLPPAELTPSD